MERNTGGDTRLIGIAHNLEVIILVEVVTRDGFVEAQQDLVAYAKDRVGRFGFTEHAWRTGILDTGEHGRSASDKAVAVTAEGYGTQVVFLLHRVTFAVETDVLDTAAANHGLGSRSHLIEAVVRIIRAEVHPCIVRLRGEFVLELDMVKVLVVDIKTIDYNRQIPSCRVLRREGIHDPFVVRHGYIHRTSHRHIVYGEGTLSFGPSETGRYEGERQILKVISLASIHLHKLGDNLSAGETDHTAFLQQRRTVNQDTCTLRVRTLCQSQRERKGVITGSVPHFTFVHQLQCEDCRLIYRHIAALVDIDIQSGVL